ncbi:Clp protease ClpP [Mesorhizobium sp. M0664]|uniref:head maturation protease, ClpP-related n=1 Tax=Mesorhizobium sp. M0664 TaxID=2956982 RepID=UPI00333542FA
MADIYRGANKIDAFGVIGDSLFDEGFSPFDFATALAKCDRTKPVEISLDCPGGVATAGVTVANLIAGFPGGSRVTVQGLAASAGSLIAMAADETIMRSGALMMIHNPNILTAGDVREHAKSIEILGQVGDAYASWYARKSGKPAADMLAVMDAETWLNGEQAVEQGFANKVEAASARAFASFDFTRYRNAPPELKALAQANGWTRAAETASASAEKDRADRLQAELDALKATGQTEKDRQAQAAAYEASRLAAARLPMSGLAQPGNRGSRSGPTTWNDFLPK